MLLNVVKALIGLALGYLTKAQLKEFADMALDFIEDAVQKSENQVDDAVVLPILKRFRESFDIPDNDPEPE
jgi:hypothetical protein